MFLFKDGLYVLGNMLVYKRFLSRTALGMVAIGCQTWVVVKVTLVMCQKALVQNESQMQRAKILV